jgi:hypothetical protein
MPTQRREFLKLIGGAGLGALLPGLSAGSTDTLAQVRTAARDLMGQGLNAVVAVQNGKSYQFDAAVKYPTQAGIVDPSHGHSFYFHSHRKQEYGHFHTFARDAYGLSVHLLMISVDSEGRPTALSTVNQWVTDDRHLRSQELMALYRSYAVDPASFAHPALVRMINALMTAYQPTARSLFEERDAWVERYRRDKGKVPYQDRTVEIISTRAINPLGAG